MSANHNFPRNVQVLNHPLVKDKMTRLRSKNTDSKTFRDLVAEISSLLSYAATADLPLETVPVETPLTVGTGSKLAARPCIIPILRAGLGMCDAVLQMMPTASVFHVGLFREESTLAPVEYYNKLPAVCNYDYLFVTDPMLATGYVSLFVSVSMFIVEDVPIFLVRQAAQPPQASFLDSGIGS